ncbi:hypothetical protein ASF84_26880 [Pseudomonas sp. Leaf127]|uniref:DUF4347 domain-containing protein n=1 Tax=Pseudomonas sp. Leaf127 TaxID=1736267 RepID=UPI0007029029|nr:DUF4347 domain-containing protein [Pseudomonas sp. Leaf127]KQQ62467.1 hypothetical protein ASF84_26880 [Pseudomonas sp. Leaf127]
MKFIERLSRKSAQQLQPVEPGQAPMLMALEPRIMFDASVGVVAQEAAAQTTADAARVSTSSNETSQIPAAAADTSSQQQGTQRQEVVFVDGQVNDTAQLLAGLSGTAEVVILDPSKDGLQQMADYLKGREGLDAIHLLSHGADGTVQTGNVWLASNNLAEHSEALVSIGSALKADGDLMLYGCDVGEGEKGQAFLDQLAAITGADVAASIDDTGAAALGGNWALERSSGAIETAALSVSGYDSLMAQNYTGGTSATAPLLASGNNLMRSVVGDFNNDGRADILYQGSGANAPWNLALGNADGTFSVVSQATSPFAGVTLLDAATGGSNYHAADFDGDGDTDLMVAAVSGSQVLLYRNNGSSFTSEDITNGNAPVFGVRSIAGDFNADGAVDLLYQTNSTSGSPWRVKLNNGNGTFVDVLSTDALSPFKNVTLSDFLAYNYKVADVDGDGDSDLMYALQNTQLQYLRNDNGVFTTVAGNLNLPVTPVNRVVLGDFDGDGDADVIYQTSGNGSAWRYARNDGTTFTDMAITSSPFAGVTLADMGNQQYRMGDFDGDGDLDIFVASSTLSSVYFQGGSSPQLASATPADNSLSVSPTANIVLTFNDVVTKGTGNIYIVRTSDNTVVQTIAVGSSAVTGSGTTWTIDPPADLAQGVAYAIRIDNKTFANADGKVYAGIRNNVALNFVTSSNAAPVITNLNGDAVSYTEGSAGVLLDSSTNTTVTDTDSANFNGGNVTVSISNNGVTSEDELWISGQGAGATNINVSGSNITYGNDLIGTYTGGTLGNPLVISLNSAATPVAVSALLQRLAYRNSNDADITPSTRTVQVTVNDGTGGTSTAASVTLSVVAVNDAPTLTATATNPTFTENGTGSTLFSGAAISTIEAGQSITGLYVQVSNLGNGNLEKLIIDGTAVTLVDQTSVTTSTNGLSVSVAVSSTTATVSITHAGLSTALAQTLVNGMAYRNDSESPTGASRTAILIGVRDSGGTSSGGSNAGIVSIASTVTVVSVNDAPTLSGGPFVLASINENTATNGYLVSTVLGSVTYGDLDTSAQTGIAVTATSGRGFWQYSTDGSNWTDIGTVSSSAALLLDSTSQVRYIPDSANSENVNFTFRAWDRTTGTASTTGNRSTVDTTTNGGSTAFSTGTAQATLVVTSVNDAPVLTPVAPSLSALTDTSTTNTGDLVSALTAGITDVDTGAVQGIAITGLTSTYGTWQYSTNGGSTWSNVDTVATTSALMLRSSDRVRFIPDGINGEIATITYKAWDQSGATSGLQGAKINVTTSGAATPFSTATDTASVVVTAVNDAPTLTGTGGSVAWTEGNNVTSTPVVIDSGLTLSDADGPGIASATVRVSGNYSNSQDVLALVSDTATMGNIIGSWNATTGILNLSSAGNLASQAQWQAALRSVTYTNLSDSPTTTTRTLEFVVTDGGGASAAAVTRSLTLTAVDDSPVITAASSTQVVEDVASAINQISLSDVDSSSGTVTLSVGAGSLAATSGSGVTVGGTSSALTLTGTLTNINTFIANNGLTYTTVANATADETLTIRVDTASASTDSTSMTLSVNPVNDAPVVTVPASISVTEDVPGALTGISFSDVDAGSASVTATFSVPSGTLTATSGSGVTVLGSGTGALSLSGSLSDINAFIAASSVSFQTALDNTSTVTLTVSINDNGNTGGSAQTDSKNVSLLVSAVNDAPVNSVPVSQSVPQDSVLTFSTANNNAIVVSDVDVGSNQIAVSLAATNGRITLATLANLTLTVGSGTNDTSVWFSGSLADVNAALDGLTFTPAAGYNGAASLQIVSSDNGNSGSGVTRTDTDAIAITVAPLNPTVTHVSVVQADGAYKAGETLDVTVTFDMAVDVAGGIPSLLLETGLTDRLATYVSGSGSNTLTFAYTVQAGDVSADLDYASTMALQLNGATIKSVSNDNAALVLPTLGGSDSIAGQKAIVIDGVVPSISSVAAPVDGTYITGQNLDFTISFSETVQVNTAGGTPRLAVTLDTGGTVYASYVSGAGSNALVFRLTAASGQLDSNGIVLGGALLLNGGSIRDTAGNDTQLTLNNVASTANVTIDGAVPVVVSVTPPADGSYKTGDTLSFTVNASEAMQTGALAPRLVLDVGGVTRYATYVSGSGSAALVFANRRTGAPAGAGRGRGDPLRHVCFRQRQCGAGVPVRGAGR